MAYSFSKAPCPNSSKTFPNLAPTGNQVFNMCDLVGTFLIQTIVPSKHLPTDLDPVSLTFFKKEKFIFMLLFMCLCLYESLPHICGCLQRPEVRSEVR